MVLFLGETIELQFLRISVVGFLTGVVCFLAAVGCFMVETLLATRLLNFGKIAKLRKH
jgi:hypothetical protein